MEAENWNREAEHPLQSWEWGEFRKQRQPISRVNGMLVVWTNIKFTPWYFGYIPMGKWPTNEDIKRLRDEAIKMRAIGIRMEPNVPKAQINNLQFTIYNDLKPGRPLFKAKTYILDLTKSEEELLKNMHPKARYNIKVARKHGVVIKEDNSAEAFEAYLNLTFFGTAARQRIYAHGRDYHTLLWNSLKDSMAHLFTATYEGKVLVADMVFKFKDRVYYTYGASGLEHKEVMAPTLLLWEIARWGKAQGSKYFDLWGAEEGKGFSKFKSQFNGNLVETAGTYDLPANKWLYVLFRLTEEIRWKILRIIK